MNILLNYHIGCAFLVRCVSVFRCGWVGVVSVLQAEPTTPTLGSMCVGVSVWSGWSGICVAGWSFSLQHGYHANPTTPKHQHTSNREHMTNVVIQQNIRKLLMMDILMSETCWAYKKWNKNSKWQQVGLLFFNYHNDAWFNKYTIHSFTVATVYRSNMFQLHKTAIIRLYISVV